eukprot:6304369-Prymnesium_polylepis.2
MRLALEAAEVKLKAPPTPYVSVDDTSATVEYCRRCCRMSTMPTVANASDEIVRRKYEYWTPSLRKVVGHAVALVVDLAQRLDRAHARRPGECAVARRLRLEHRQQHAQPYLRHARRRRLRRLAVVRSRVRQPHAPRRLPPLRPAAPLRRAWRPRARARQPLHTVDEVAQRV